MIPVEDLKDAFAADRARRAPRPRHPTDPVCIIWTSGTTGVPKGAVYTHESMAGDRPQRHRHERAATTGRCSPCPSPTSATWAGSTTSRSNRVTLVLGPQPWSAPESLRLAADERITMMTGVPTQWALVLDRADVDGHRLLAACGSSASGAAAAPPELIRRMRETLGCPCSTATRRPRPASSPAR